MFLKFMFLICGTLLCAVFLLRGGCEKLKFKTSGLRFFGYLVELFTGQPLDLLDLRIAVKVWALQFESPYKFP